MVVTTIRSPGRKWQSWAWDIAFKTAVAVMKTLWLRVVLQLRSGRTSCNPRQANSRARVLNPGLAAGRTGLESCSCHFRRCDLSKSLANLALGFLTCKWGWPLTPQGSFSLDATVVLGSHPIYLCPLTCGQAVRGHAPCCPTQEGGSGPGSCCVWRRRLIVAPSMCQALHWLLGYDQGIQESSRNLSWTLKDEEDAQERVMGEGHCQLVQR